MDTTLVTGFPSFTARRMILKQLTAARGKKSGRDDRVVILVRHQDAAEANELVAGLPEAQQKRAQVLIGDVTNMDLGLSGREYRTLTAELTYIHHLAARYHLGASKEELQQHNVGGTRGVVELALECKDLKCFAHWSTVLVSGEREGVVMEDELELGQRFHNEYEHTKYAAEKVVRSISRRVPATIIRPGLIVGDSVTGEVGRYDGPYNLIRVLMNSPFDLQLPLPGQGVGPFHLVPVDFVIDAGYALARMPRAVSRTFHVVDPCPLSARSVYELVADRAYRKVPKSVIPQSVAKAMLRVPWVGKLKGSPRTIMEGFNQQVFYNCRNALDLLGEAGIRCPSFDAYVDNLVRYAKDWASRRRGQQQDDDVADPLD